MSAAGEPYEADEILSQYLLFHYGTKEESCPWASGPRDGLDYPRRCVTENLDTTTRGPGRRALDIGCAVGRSTFELARHFDEVIGIDYSRKFIQAAQGLQQDGQMDYRITEVGTITHPACATIDPDIDRSRVTFEVGDAHDLRSSLGTFDCVLAANLVCRLRTPRHFLRRLPSLLKPGGLLVLTTPNTWLDEYTPVKNWVGATPETGQPIEVLRRELSEHFTLLGSHDMPFLIREHLRKYQWSVALASRWQRNA